MSATDRLAGTGRSRKTVMKHKERGKMSRGQRAKQFLPYEALEGLEDELLNIERAREEEQAKKERGEPVPEDP